MRLIDYLSKPLPLSRAMISELCRIQWHKFMHWCKSDVYTYVLLFLSYSLIVDQLVSLIAGFAEEACEDRHFAAL